jgi:putative nucleotidyltransferase with HDIG domain
MNSQPHILVIDDEPDILDVIREALEIDTYQVTTITDPFQVESVLRDAPPDAVITDIHMPKRDGVEIIGIVKQFDPHIPVIVITGHADVTNLMASFRQGAYDYLKKPFQLDELLITVNQAVDKHSLEKQVERYYNELEDMVVQKTQELSKANLRLESNLLGAIRAMVNALDASDQYTRGHSERVTALAVMIGKQMKLDLGTLKVLRLGAILHDIGKIGIPHDILHKPNSLSDDEYEEMKQHPLLGERIMIPIGLDDRVLEIVRQHHERIDGTGYPFGIKEDQITLLARIVAVADTFDAMTSDRPYRKGLSREEAMREILEYRDHLFDPNVTNALFEIYPNLDDDVLQIIAIHPEEFIK